MYTAVAEVDVITCYAGAPQGLAGRIYRVEDYQTPEARKSLFAELSARGYGAIAIICSAEPIMTKWKWALATRVPAKLLIVNENADFFWCDVGNWRLLIHFALFRAGVTGASAIPALGRMLFFPVTAAYLLLYAAAVHFRRALRYRKRIRTS